jgi:hypothetical protein
LGQPISVAQRWADSGMPVEKRGRYVYLSREELNRWLGRQSAGEPVQIATESADLSSELRRGLSYARQHRSVRKREVTSHRLSCGPMAAGKPILFDSPLAKVFAY